MARSHDRTLLNNLFGQAPLLRRIELPIDYRFLSCLSSLRRNGCSHERCAQEHAAMRAEEHGYVVLILEVRKTRKRLLAVRTQDCVFHTLLLLYFLGAFTFASCSLSSGNAPTGRFAHSYPLGLTQLSAWADSQN